MQQPLVLHDRQCIAVAFDGVYAIQLSTNAHCQAVSWQYCECQSSELSALHMTDSLSLHVEFKAYFSATAFTYQAPTVQHNILLYY